MEKNRQARRHQVIIMSKTRIATLNIERLPIVFVHGHSRGTSVWTPYLDDPSFGGPAKVAKYVNIDGRSPEELPGGVPTIGIWGEWNTADIGYNRSDDNSSAQIGPNPEDNYYFPDKSHTETATPAGTGTVELVLVTRGGGETRVNVPNWPSGRRRVSVMFMDDTL